MLRFFFGTVALAASLSVSANPDYFTTNGLEPDKWASVWVMDRHGKPVDVRPRWGLGGEGVPVDIPGSGLHRRDGKLTYQVVLEYLEQTDPALRHIGDVIADIEQNTWAKNGFDETHIVESRFRSLQERYDRFNVPVRCYFDFFDTFRNWIAENESSVDELDRSLSEVEAACGTDEVRAPLDKRNQYVSTVALSEVLALHASGARVVFVDTREPEEYLEGHIPGAIHLPLRSLSEFPDTLREADMVVSYCVKDFRGYEVASDLLNMGVRNSVIMKPYGIKGWIGAGLPVESGADPDPSARERMLACADGAAACDSLRKP